MAQLLGYTAGDVDMAVDNDIVEDVAEGSFIKAMTTVPRRKLVVGSKGSAVVVTSEDKSGSIEVTIQKTSASNALFSALAESGKKVAVQITDRNNAGLLVQSGNAVVEKQADYEASAELTNNVWKLLCGQLNITHAGADS